MHSFLLAGRRRIHILGPLLVLMFWTTTGLAWADEARQSVQSSPATDDSAPSSSTVASIESVQPGPFEVERLALLKEIAEAKGKGIGNQAYMNAFLNLEGMVRTGASEDSIRGRLDSLRTALNEQLSAIRYKTKSSWTSASSDSGIVGLQFKVAYPQSPEISSIVPDAPAARGQLRIHDIITHVNGCPTKGLTKEAICMMIVGRPNTKAKITIQRGGTTFAKTLTRMPLKDLAKSHPAIWKMYLSAM